MPRVLLVIAWLAITVFAIADWARTPEEEMPGRVPRIMWLIIILLTIPSFSIGAIVWLVVRAIGRAESSPSGGRRPLLPRRPGPERAVTPPEPLAPDDDPEFLFRLERDIRRRRAEEARRDSPAGTVPGSPAGPRSPTPDSIDEGAPSSAGTPGEGGGGAGGGESAPSGTGGTGAPTGATGTGGTGGARGTDDMERPATGRGGADTDEPDSPDAPDDTVDPGHPDHLGHTDSADDPDASDPDLSDPDASDADRGDPDHH